MRKKKPRPERKHGGAAKGERPQEFSPENEARLRFILDQMPAVLWCVDKDLVITYSAGAGLIGLNLKPGQLIGVSLFDFLGTRDEDFPTIRGARQALEGRPASWHVQVKGRFFQSHIEPLHGADKRIIGAIAISIDVTESRKTENLLLESEERFQKFMDHNPAVAWMKDEQFRYVYLSKAFERRFGRRFEDMRGKTDFEVWPEPVARLLRANDEQALASGQALHTYEDVPTPDGVLRYWYVLKFPFVNPSGQRFVSGLGVDITPLKEAQDALSRQAQELMRSNADLEQFASVASHDLKEPLRVVASYLQLLESKAKDKLNEDERRYIDRAVNSSMRMQALIEDLLTYSRVGRHPADVKEIESGSVFAHVLENLKDKIERAQAQVEAGTLPPVRYVETEFLQVLQNLVTNGIKFNQSREPRVRVTAEARGGEWVFCVRDNGIGIDPAYFDKIFMIFHRLHGRERYSGNGIGLAICKKIVEKHGGRIWVESEFGKGSAFYFTVKKEAFK